MDKLKKFFKKQIYVDFWKGFFITILISFVSVWLVLFFSGGMEGVKVFLTSGNTFIYFTKNFIPVFLSFAILYFATNNLVLTNGLLLLFYSILSIINNVKISLRGVPLYYNDFLLANEVLNVMKNKGFVYVVFGIILTIFLVFCICVLSRIIKTKKFDTKKRVIISVLLTGILIVINMTLLTNEDEYYIQQNKYNIIEQYNSRGFIYSFIYDFNNSGIDDMETFDIEINEDNIKNYKDITGINTENLPVIIMIQSEAYAEFGMSDKINFDNYTDPYKNYKEIISKSYHGELIVPNYGGGTSDTEFDILTGMNTRFLRFAPYSYLLITNPVDSIASMLKELGYYTLAMHPWDSWYYERERTFEYIGFDEFVHKEDFDQNDTKGGFITEEQTFNSIINSYKEFVDNNGNKPYFSFNITIQNHGPFNGKYRAEQNFDNNINMNPADVSTLSNFFVGVQDIDIELKKLVDFFEEEDRPVVVVYWSDHLPSISLSIIRELMDVDKNDDLRYNTFGNIVPFFIWENSVSKETIGVVEKLNSKNINIPISDFYLSSLLFDVLGFEGLSYYMDFNNNMMDDYPILLEESYYSEETGFSEYSEDDLVGYYMKLIEYRLFEN